jgi:predicted transcriptional regulator
MDEANDSGQPIPAHLASQVPPELQKPLRHAYRRQILRALRDEAETLSAFELAGNEMVPCPVSCASYHLQVLQGSGLVATARAANGDTARQHFAATPEQDNVVLEVLRETAPSDREQLGGAPA